MREELLEKFLSQYNESERKIVQEAFKVDDKFDYNILGKVLNKTELQNPNNVILSKNISDRNKNKIFESEEKLSTYMKHLNKRFLWKINMNFARHGNRLDSLTKFLIMTYDEPEKRKEILEHLKPLSDTRQRGIILETMVSMMKEGNVTLDNINLDCCNDKDGIILNTQFENKKWFVAIDGPKNDGISPNGHWITFLSDKRVQAKSFRDAYEKLTEEAERVHHDGADFELGMTARNNSDFTLINIVEIVADENENIYKNERER